MRILLVEDDPVLGDVMQRSLRQRGHRVDAAAQPGGGAPLVADAALRRRAAGPEPAAFGRAPRAAAWATAWTWCARRARAATARRCMVLTARDRTEQRIAGLDAGADDYLGKPFELAEVEARLRALLRRAHATDDHRAAWAGWRLDRRAGRVAAGRRAPWDLPAREFEVLRELLTPPGRVVSKRMLSDKLSDADEVLGDNALEAFISRLRKKLAGSGARIRTLRGLGYVVEPDEA
jgi:two-component system OmpR family response regulator